MALNVFPLASNKPRTALQNAETPKATSHFAHLRVPGAQCARVRRAREPTCAHHVTHANRELNRSNWDIAFHSQRLPPCPITALAVPCPTHPGVLPLAGTGRGNVRLDVSENPRWVPKSSVGHFGRWVRRLAISIGRFQLGGGVCSTGRRYTPVWNGTEWV